MPHISRKILVGLLRLLLPGTAGRCAGGRADALRAAPYAGARRSWPYGPPGARAARAERWLRRRRRWAAWLAAYGVDVGPRRIHGVRVARAGVTTWR
ncbi:hypothetical protein RKE29_08300 [Streptomyces sp. B1866]|nr:hypothetical protein [Streptomyces sp. B1866]